MAVGVQWQASARIVSRMGEWRGVLACVFVMWGVVGFAGVSVEVIGVLHARSLGLTINAITTTFIAMEALWWIGGMVLLGIGALLAGARLTIERPATT
jgi:hypothetical protein